MHVSNAKRHSMQISPFFGANRKCHCCVHVYACTRQSRIRIRTSNVLLQSCSIMISNAVTLAIYKSFVIMKDVYLVCVCCVRAII